jgi:hypothetical protein
MRDQHVPGNPCARIGSALAQRLAQGRVAIIGPTQTKFRADDPRRSYRAWATITAGTLTHESTPVAPDGPAAIKPDDGGCDELREVVAGFPPLGAESTRSGLRASNRAGSLGQVWSLLFNTTSVTVAGQQDTTLELSLLLSLFHFFRAIWHLLGR